MSLSKLFFFFLVGVGGEEAHGASCDHGSPFIGHMSFFAWLECKRKEGGKRKKRSQVNSGSARLIG